jgi:hypothetical protein
MGISNARECNVEIEKVIMQEWLVVLGVSAGALRIAPACLPVRNGHCMHVQWTMDLSRMCNINLKSDVMEALSEVQRMGWRAQNSASTKRKSNGECMHAK